MSIDPAKLKGIFETLKNDLGAGFIATDIWAAADARPLLAKHGYNKHPDAVALFNEVTLALNKTLRGSDYPGLGNYYLVNLHNNHLAVVLSVDSYQQFVLLDLSKTTIGILMSVALPNLLNSLAGAEIMEGREETDPASNPSTLRKFFNAFSKSLDDDSQLLNRRYSRRLHR